MNTGGIKNVMGAGMAVGLSAAATLGQGSSVSYLLHFEEEVRAVSGDGRTILLVDNSLHTKTVRGGLISNPIVDSDSTRALGQALSQDGSQIGGNFQVSLPNGTSIQRGFRCEVDGSPFLQMDPRNDFGISIFGGMSRLGNIVAGNADCVDCGTINYAYHPAYWIGTELHYLPTTFLNRDRWYATAVNLDGSVIAGNIVALGHDQLVVWENGNYHILEPALPIPDGSYHLRVDGLSDDGITLVGQVWGIASDPAATDSHGRMFLYNWRTGAVSLLTGAYSGPLGADNNHDASVVTNLLNSAGDAVLWTRDRGVSRVLPFLGEAGINTFHWNELRRVHCSTDGRTLAGNTVYDGEIQVVGISTLPEAGTYGVFNDAPTSAMSIFTLFNDSLPDWQFSAGSTRRASYDGASTGGLGVPVETPGVWYRFEGSGQTVTVAVRPYDSFNPRVHVYCGAGGVTNLRLIAAADNTGRGSDETITLCTEPGTPYFIQVSGSASGLDSPTGEFRIALVNSPGPCTSAAICSPLRGACTLTTGECLTTTSRSCQQLRGNYCGDGSSCTGPGRFEASVSAGYDQSDLLTPEDGFVSLGDDAGATVQLPFAFPFYGLGRTSVNICSNGFVTFAGDGWTAYQNTTIPTSAAPNAAIYGLWEDLVPGAVGYKTLGTAPNRRFVMEWIGSPRFSQQDRNTFQVVLFENGVIEARYDAITPVGGGVNPTVGIENGDGSDGVTVSPALLGSGFKTIRYSPTPGVPACPRPCPPDFNEDFQLNPDDLGDFITCYFATPACDRADWNLDGEVNPDDLGDYITAYFQGCEG